MQPKEEYCQCWLMQNGGVHCLVGGRDKTNWQRHLCQLSIVKREQQLVADSKIHLNFAQNIIRLVPSAPLLAFQSSPGEAVKPVRSCSL